MRSPHERLNTAVRDGRAAAERHLPELEQTYATLLRAAGRAAARSFTQQTAMTAAIQPWEPPGGDLVDGEALEQDAQTRVQRQHARILKAVAPTGDLGISWDVSHATAQSLLAGVAARLSTLGDAIRTQVNEQIQAGYADGLSVTKTAAAIVTKVDEVTPGRAAMLARTDLNALSNGASVGMAAQIDGVTSKSWLATEDERTRDDHVEADGQTVPIDQQFTVGGEQCDFPGDPGLSDAQAANCRCTVIYGDDMTASADEPIGGEMTTTLEEAQTASEPTDPLDAMTAAELRDLATRAEERAGHLERSTLILTDIELTAAADGAPTGWRATLLVEDEITEDGRLLLPGSISWRQLPLTLGLMTETPHSYEMDAPVCGRIDMIWRAGNAIQASGVFTDNSDDEEVAATGRQAVALIADRVIRGISVDLAVLDGDTLFIPDQVLDTAGEDELPDVVAEDLAIVDGQDAEIVIVVEEDPAGRYVWAVREGVVGSACVVPFPAIAQATIEVVTAAAGFQVARVTSPLFDCGCDALAASAAPLRPPADWFDDPGLDKPTPLTVTDDGRVYGHIALWDSCHTGYNGRCVPPPRSRTGYSHFHVGELELDTGDRVPVGKITLKAGHAGTNGVTAAQARAHYDDSATVGALVRAGEDKFGIWNAGALRSDLSPEARRDLMANPPSGDWRNSEMIAVHAVPTPGFPVLRASALDDAGEERETALIMASPFTLGETVEDEPAGALSYLRPGRKVKTAA